MLQNVLFSEAVYVQQLVCASVTAQKLPASTGFIDVGTYSRFAFLIGIGAVDEASTYQVQQDKSATQTAAIKAVTGAVVIVPAATGDNKWYLIEVGCDQLDINNDFRYVTLDLTGPTDGDDIAAVYFLGFNDGKIPVTPGSDKGEIVTLAG
jgi:hypothetical protein